MEQILPDVPTSTLVTTMLQQTVTMERVCTLMSVETAVERILPDVPTSTLVTTMLQQTVTMEHVCTLTSVETVVERTQLDVLIQPRVTTMLRLDVTMDLVHIRDVQISQLVISMHWQAVIMDHVLILDGTDGSACNYDATAGCDDGSCIYPGCTDDTACNYDALAGCEDGSCLYFDECGNCVEQILPDVLM